jgi:hypothetical protein
VNSRLLGNVIQGVMLVVASGCAAEPDSETDGPVFDAEQSWESFRASAYHEPFENGVFIVDGDTPISDENELRWYYDTYVSPAGQALTVLTAMGADVIWSREDKFSLTYCISDSFGGRKTDVINGMDSATRSWIDVVAVSFRYVPAEDAGCTASNTNVTFDVNPVTGVTYFARSFFPNGGRAQRNVLIADAAFTTTAGGRDFQGILRHELGHALGFRHEHIWSATCAGESTNDARLVTEYDSNSVMHYPQCRPINGGGYRQAESDYRGAVSLYGLSPALIVSSHPFL